MLRLVGFLIAVALLASGLAWLADRPGSIVVNWQGYEIETSVFRAIVMLALLLGLAITAWSILVQLWRSPAMLGMLFNRRRQARGLEALSSGMIALGAGDRAMATRYAVQARRAMPNEPLTHLLRAQAAQLAGDRTTARRIFEAMLAAPETEQLGLRGLYLEAEREGEREAARQFAERALRLNPRLGWPVDALFDIQCKDNDWEGALETLAIARRNHLIEKPVADRRRAVLLTARAQALEDVNPDRAVQLALEAHHLANDLIPAAAIAGRLLAARGNTKRAAHVIERIWRRAPHPDLATAYAYARLGDSPRDRLDRVKRLAPLNQHSMETPLAIATAAVEARDWETARRQLEGLADEHMTQRACTLMARIEGDEKGDQGKVRQWLARAVHAPRDAAWTADGVVSEQWAPVSPVTGALDAFEWRVPVSALAANDTAAIARKLDDLARIGSGTAPPGETDAGKPETMPHVPDQRDSEWPSRPVRDVASPDAEIVAITKPAIAASTAELRTDREKPAPISTRPVPKPSGERMELPTTANRAAVTRTSLPNGAEVEPARPAPDAPTQSGREAPSRERSGREAQVFVASRAPDDPGIDTKS